MRAGVGCFVFLGPRLEVMHRLLAKAFEHPWVASYQIGFGPPLVRANGALRTRLEYADSALDKLRAYLETCVYDAAERTRLAALHRKQLTRRRGPLEAEELRLASADVLDLSLRLHLPDRAPPSVQADMQSSGVRAEELPSELPPDAQASRFWVHLDDPRNGRLLFDEQVAAAVDEPERALALELWVPIGLLGLYRIWTHALARDAELTVLDLGAPRSVARVLRDGQRS